METQYDEQAPPRHDEEQDGQGYSMEAFFAEESAGGSLEEARKIAAAGLSPAGTYYSDPDNTPLRVTPILFQDDDGNKRAILNVTGRVTGKVKGEEVSTFIRCRLSPDLRYKNDFETGEPTEKPDMASRLWSNVKLAYAKTFEGEDASRQQVVEFLETVPLGFRVIQVGVPTKSNPNPDGEPSNIVVGIFAKREKK